MLYYGTAVFTAVLMAMAAFDERSWKHTVIRWLLVVAVLMMSFYAGRGAFG